jgi:hypothetical protein
MDVESAPGFLYQALHDIQSQAGALSGALCRKIGLEDFGQNLGRNAWAIIAHRQHQQWRGVVEILHIEQAVLKPILEAS